MLFIQDGVSSSMLDDINSFDYDWLFRLVTRMHWGEDVTNLILVGMPDVVTPAHYDSLENLYVQVANGILFVVDCLLTNLQKQSTQSPHVFL